MIFSEYNFDDFENESLFKEQMKDGLSDPTLHSFSPLSHSSYMKEEIRKAEFETEYIEDYLQATKALATVAHLSNSPTPCLYTMRNYSLALPTLFLSRHCIELSIKSCIRRLGGTAKDSHKLDSLWSSLLSKIPTARTPKEQHILDEMHNFVKVFDTLDADGTKLRYSIDKFDTLNQEKFLWVNCIEIEKKVEQFVRQLEHVELVKEKNI